MCYSVCVAYCSSSDRNRLPAYPDPCTDSVDCFHSRSSVDHRCCSPFDSFDYVRDRDTFDPPDLCRNTLTQVDRMVALRSDGSHFPVDKSYRRACRVAVASTPLVEHAGSNSRRDRNSWSIWSVRSVRKCWGIDRCRSASDNCFRTTSDRSRWDKCRGES